MKYRLLNASTCSWMCTHVLDEQHHSSQKLALQSGVGGCDARTMVILDSAEFAFRTVVMLDSRGNCLPVREIEPDFRMSKARAYPDVLLQLAELGGDRLQLQTLRQTEPHIETKR